MKLLFLDDSSQAGGNYLGYGGFCIDEASIRPLAFDLAKLKRKHGIPSNIELKFSPGQKHYLMTEFTGDLNKVRKEAAGLLHRYDASVICAVRSFTGEVHPKDYRKEILRASTEEQLNLILERFNMHLSGSGQKGMVIMDEYADIKEGKKILEEAYESVTNGTEFMRLDRIAMVPVMTSSHHVPHMQLADIVIGSVVAALCNKRHGLELFKIIAKCFRYKPHKSDDCRDSFWNVVNGAGLKLIGRELFPIAEDLFKGIEPPIVCPEHGIE